MSGKIPDLKQLRRILENSNTKIHSGRNTSMIPSSSPDHPPAPRSKTPTNFDLQLIGQIQKEIADIDK